MTVPEHSLSASGLSSNPQFLIPSSFFSTVNGTLKPLTVIAKLGLRMFCVKVSSCFPPIDGLIGSVQFSRSVVSHSLWPHESQHARPPCPCRPKFRALPIPRTEKLEVKLSLMELEFDSLPVTARPMGPWERATSAYSLLCIMASPGGH